MRKKKQKNLTFKKQMFDIFAYWNNESTIKIVAD